MIYIRQHTEGFYSRVMGGGASRACSWAAKASSPLLPTRPLGTVFPAKPCYHQPTNTSSEAGNIELEINNSIFTIL